MKGNTIVLGCLLFIQSACNKQEKTLEKIETPPIIKQKSIPVKEPEYSIDVEKIDSTQFYSHKPVEIKENIVKISNFPQAKEMLKGIVEFNDEDEDGESHAIKKIHFRNNKKSGNTNEYDYHYFVAYYPQEDILLCEGGHTTDISFNLSNGKETEQIGNPDYIRTAKNKKYRFNGYFGGQECSTYFIQKKINNEYVKIIDLDKEFESKTKIWLCIVGKTFWYNNNTIYLTEESNYTEKGLNKRYFKIKILEK